MSLGTRGRCEICKEMFLYKDLVKFPYNKGEQKGFDKIFDTGYHYYCKKCNKIEDLKKELKEHWKRTEKKRKLTHTDILYENFLKNKNELI